MIQLGPDRILRLLAKTPLPWRAIHVAGTNGKGSICAYVSAMLDVYNRSRFRSDGKHPVLSHGRFTSPHLIDRWDCISINQKTISFSTFQRMEETVQKRNESEGIGASEFELLTATAFEIFAQQKVDVAVVEVGMGGRLDATNIIGQTEGLELPADQDAMSFRPPPLVTAISNIGLDHQDFLGNTLQEIARQKAGIIKPGVPVVMDESSANPAEAREVIQSRASDQGSPIIRFDDICDMAGSPLPKIEMRLDGRSHIKQNEKVALLATWTALRRLNIMPMGFRDGKREIISPGLPKLANDMLNAARDTIILGRQQRLCLGNRIPTNRLQGVRKKRFLADGAHNAQSARLLAKVVNAMRKSRGREAEAGVSWVLAASDTKDAKGILSKLLHNGDTVFAVEFGPVDGMPWVKPLPASQLLEAAKAVVSDPESLKLTDCGRSVTRALIEAHKAPRPLVVAGSLYLVGDVLRLMREEW